MEMVVIFFLAILGFMVSPSMAVDYPISWSLGVDYSTWSTGKSINAGDTLTFTYNPSLHSVDELSSKSNYDSCNTAGMKSDSSGEKKVTLDKPSTTYYFACGFTGHCAAGMKLAVTTLAASETSNNIPTSSPPSSANDGGSTTASPATPSASSSSSSSSSPPPPPGSGEAPTFSPSTAAAAGMKGGFAVMLGLALLA